MTNLDIEIICQDYGQGANPPDAFLVAGDEIGGQLLCVSIFFLEDGQQVPCPGLPFLGAAFGPDWGFSQAEVGIRANGSVGFRLPQVNADALSVGDLYGYRLCVIEDHEVPKLIRQLAQIRTQLGPHKGSYNKPQSVVRVTRL